MNINPEARISKGPSGPAESKFLKSSQKAQSESSIEPQESFQATEIGPTGYTSELSQVGDSTRFPHTITLCRNGYETGFAASMEAVVPAPVATALHESFQRGFVDNYLAPLEIRARVEALQKEFPDLVEVIPTGYQTFGYDGKNVEHRGSSDLYYLRIGPQTEDRDSKTGIFQYAAPHARELMNPMTMVELTEQLVRNYDPESEDPEVQANTRLLDQLDVFIAPMTNPDGAAYALFDDPKWRKNRAPIGEGKVGVDINRNYPYMWEASERLDSQTYSGSGPASEAETKSIISVADRHKNIKFVVDWHSYSEDLRRPIGVTPEHDNVYDELHGRVSQAIEAVAGNHYKPIVSQIISGTSDDYFYHEKGVISTVMETGKAFAPPVEEALVVMEESVAGAREFMEAAIDLAPKLG